MSTERVFIIGGTGNIGKKVVEDLVAKQIPVTLFARNPAKVSNIFSNSENIKVVEGDLSADLEPLKDALKGHTRLFIVVGIGSRSMAETKGSIAKYAYDAGVKQIVDVSSLAVSYPWRTNYIGQIHYDAEKAILDTPNRANFVTLRPGRFMSNILNFDRVSPQGVFMDIADENSPQGWISPDDIGAIAANILSEDVQKHGDSVYELIGDSISASERAKILSRVLNKEIRYQKLSSLERYNQFIKFNMPHVVAFVLSSHPISAPSEGAVSTGIPILLGREAETFEQFVIKNKDSL